MRTLLTLMLIASTAACAWCGQVVYAGFDDFPPGTPWIGDHYPGLYVPGRALQAPSSPSPPNIAGGIDGDTLYFTSGALWARVYSAGAYWVGAFASDQRLLGERWVDAYAGWLRIEFQLSEPIWRIGAATHYGTSWWIDDLSYEIVPEPASLAGVVLGLAGLVGWRVRRRA